MIAMEVEANWEKGNFETHIRAGKRSIVHDEAAAAANGNASGTDSLQDLLSALADCLIGMGKLVAKEHGLIIDDIACRVEGDVDADAPPPKHAAARPNCQEVRMIVTMQSDETEASLDKWLKEVEKRCPIHGRITRKTQTNAFAKN